jgi:hypothetical protein
MAARTRGNELTYSVSSTAMGLPWRDIRARALSQSLAAHASEQVLFAIPEDVPRADQPLELFWLKLLPRGLPLQFSDDLLHAAQPPE